MKKDAHIYISLALLAIGVFLAMYYLNVGPTGFVVSQIISDDSFDGEKINLSFKEGALELSEMNLSGVYISNQFQIEENVSWNNLTWIGNENQGNLSFLICFLGTCSDENFTESDLNNLNVAGKYLQYKAIFTRTNESDPSPVLSNVSVSYTTLEPEAVCDANNPDLCLTQEECENELVGGFWYDANDNETLTCNVNPEPACSNDFTLCNEENCTSEGGGYWYDDLCNEYECATDEQCNSEYECVSGDCIQIETSSTTDETTDPEPTPIENPEPVQVQEQPYVPVTSLTADNIQNIKLIPGESKDISWNVRNTGDTFLNSCTFNIMSEEFSEWISFNAEEGREINPGDQTTFSFLINTPENAEDGQYTLSVSIQCAQKAESKEFIIEIESKKLGFEILSVDRTKKDRVRVIYSLEELTGEPQDVELQFYIKDLEDIEASNVSENKSITANTSKEFRVNMPINESLEGNLTLIANLNSEVYSSSIMEPITLGAPIGGFAIFEGIGTGGIILLIIVVLVLIIIFFGARKLRTSKKGFKDSKRKD